MEQNLPSQQKTSLLRRFLPYLLRYKGILVFDLVCAGLTTLCELVLPLMLRAITNRAAENLASLTLGFILQVGAVYLVLRVLDAAANYFMQSTGHVMGAHIETDMRRDAFAHLQRLSDAYFASTKVGQIMGRLTNDLFDVTEFAHHCPEEFFIAILKGTAAFIILLRTNVPLTLLIFACLPVMLVCCTRFNHMVRVTFRRQRRQIGELNARIEDSLLGERVVKAFSGEEEETDGDLSPRTMFVMAVATSIDALAVGISLAMTGNVNIWMAIAAIGITTFLLSAVGVKVGSVFGCRYEKRAQIAGGVILICLGLKILMEHLGVL